MSRLVVLLVLGALAGGVLAVLQSGWRPKPSSAPEPGPDQGRTAPDPASRALPAPGMAGITGRIVDQLGTPVAGVAVAGGPDTEALSERPGSRGPLVRTGSDGRFRLDVVAGTPCGVVAHHPHFAPLRAARLLRVAAGDVHDLGDVVLPAPPGLIVEVRAMDSQLPLVGATVTTRLAAVRADFPSFGLPAHERSARTDTRGIATLYGMAAGDWVVRVGASGHATMEVPHVQPPAPPRAPRLLVPLPRGLELTGAVADAAGNPVPEATIWCRPESTGDSPAVAVSGDTDSNGRFRIGGLEPRAYRVSVESYERGTLTREGVDPAAGFLQLQLPAGHEISGQVLDAVQRQGVAGALVVLEFAAGWPILRQGRVFRPETRTDAAGNFRFRGIPEGRITLIASSEGRNPVRLGPIASPTRPVTLLLQEGFRVTGKVLSPAGVPLEDAVIHPIRQREGVLQPSGLVDLVVPGRGRPTDARSGAGGRFTVAGLAAGSYRLLVRAAGLPPTLSEAFSAEPGMHQDLGAITIHRGAVVNGIALDSEGRPAVGATVYLDPKQNLGAGIGGAKVVTDSRGQFRMPAVAPGAYRMFYDYPDQETPRQAALTRARTGTDLDLEDGATVHHELKPRR